MTDVIDTKPIAPIVARRQFLEARIEAFRTALPAHINPDRFISVVMTALRINPDLLACTPTSLFNASMRAAQDGLLPDGTQGAIVAYGDKANWIPMYEGILLQFRNSGQFKHINTGIVYAGETFHYWIDEQGEHFRHVPGDERDPKKIRRVYATATTKDGAFFFRDLTVEELNKHKAQSRTKREDAPWHKWEQAMQRKTALKVLSKLLPKSSDVYGILKRDDDDDDDNNGIEGDTIEPRAIAPLDTVSTLDAFGATDAAPLPASDALEEGGTANETRTPVSPPRESSAVPADPPEIDIAFQRGKTDRARGAKRSAVPGEYRENNKLALAWVSGWQQGAR